MDDRLGPVMLDVAGCELTAEDRALLREPLVGGVILFARNFDTPTQLAALTAAIRAVRPLLIAVDHEGGRVQRFRGHFTAIPPMRVLGELHDRAPESALQAAHAIGTIIGAELRERGVDLSFTPVLDLDFGESSVIGDRAFHRQPMAVGALACALIAGLATVGVGAVGKHFPGHGFVRADSHHEVPVDERSLAEIRASDLQPYQLTIPAGLAGVMPAHVFYPKVDDRPAGFSRLWLEQVLRAELGFRGLIFSDDLSMEGARTAGGVVARAEAALGAGCDMVLVCNAPEAARELIAGLSPRVVDVARLARFRPASRGPAPQVRYLEARRALARLLPT